MAIADHFPRSLRTFTPDEPLQLDSGQQLSGATIAYQTWGTLNAARDNVIWVCHALTASSDVEQWWHGLFGRGRTLDPARHFIVCANVLGSCYGTLGPATVCDGERLGSKFPTITIADIVRQQRRLADHLGLERLALVIGASMGGFQVLEWARQDPLAVQRIALIATSWRQPPQALAQGRLQLEFIRRDPSWQGGDFQANNAPTAGLALARQLGHLTYRSAQELDERFARTQRDDGHWQVLSYLDHQGEKLVQRFDAGSYVRLTEAMNDFDFAAGESIETALARLPQPALVVALNSDQLYYPSEQARLARALPAGRLATLDTLYGHDGFLVDAAKLDPIVQVFLANPVAAADSLRARTARRHSSNASRVPLVLIGATGRVGRELLALLAQPDVQLPIQLVGVASSRAALLAPDGLPFGLAAERLAAHTGGHAQALIETLIQGGRPAILVDCTANETVAANTARLLHAGIAVVTPNKIAFANDDPRLREAIESGAPLAYSATVGAGLPAIATIKRLRAAGDRVLAIEAGLSGTLGYVLTRTQNGVGLCDALTEAVQQGLAEPDPRNDLSGEDVRRKLAILLRAAGLDAQAQRIALTPLLPLVGNGTWQVAVASREAAWRTRVDAAAADGRRLVYRARYSIEDGASVALAAVDRSDPLAGARGTQNCIVLRTQIHRDPPIVITGAGAGVRITAAAVLADIEQVLRQLVPAPYTEVLRLTA